MAMIPRNDPILHELNSKVVTQALRGHLGLSMVGEECLRKLQYNHYWTFSQHYSTRIERLFNVGNEAEEIMIRDLAKVGIIVGEQQLEITGTAGHWMGHIDGIGLSLGKSRFLVEFKTHNDASFKDLKKNKVKKSKPLHYGQCQTYMGYLGLPNALYMALNKNTSEYYIEWIEFDEEYFKDSKRKEMEVVSADTLLPRVGTGKPTWFKCKMCDARHSCFGGIIEKSCRTCQHVDVLDNGIWACVNPILGKCIGQHLTVDAQRIGCPSYKRGEMFDG